MSTSDLITGKLNHSQRLKGAVNYVSWSANMKKVLKSKVFNKYFDMIILKVITDKKVIIKRLNKALKILKITIDFIKT